MKTIDLSPLYRSSIGFDHLASMLEGAFHTDQTSVGYPPYNIEVMDDNRYAITLAVAGFSQEELNIQVEGGVLTIRGKKKGNDQKRDYLYQGIATRTFERKFNLADYVEVTNANLSNGLLTIGLVREIPEAMKPKHIAIESDESNIIDHMTEDAKAA